MFMMFLNVHPNAIIFQYETIMILLFVQCAWISVYATWFCKHEHTLAHGWAQAHSLPLPLQGTTCPPGAGPCPIMCPGVALSHSPTLTIFRVKQCDYMQILLDDMLACFEFALDLVMPGGLLPPMIRTWSCWLPARWTVATNDRFDSRCGCHTKEQPCIIKASH